MGGRFVVEGPDSLWTEAVLESGGVGLDSARWSRDKEFMGEVVVGGWGGVRHYTHSYTEAVFVMFYIGGRETPMRLCAVFIICCRDLQSDTLQFPY